MNKKMIQRRFVLLFCCIVFVIIAGSRAQTKKMNGLAKTTTNDVYHPMLINNIFNYYSNNGDGSFNYFSATAEGFEFPKRDDYATCFFEDGIIWGCKQNGMLKVGGSAYWHGLQAGPIITRGSLTTNPSADDPTKSSNRLYRVRRDMKPVPGTTNPDDPAAAMELTVVQRDEVPLIGRYEKGVTAEDILAQYWADWNTWPVSKGAPFIDVDSNGVYDPAIDIPGVPFADQTMWHVANDLDSGKVYSLSGSTPIGLEIQRTIWAYTIDGVLANTIFVSTKIINKSGKQLDSMYIAQWTDPDIGDVNDDFTGCDTILNLGYAYNGRLSDANFQKYGLIPPAAGFCLLQGPLVQGAATDSATFDLQFRPGYKNLPMTAFNYFINGNITYSDPPGGGTYERTIEWYNLLRGLIGTTGAPYINPATQSTTKFNVSGDPVTGKGWIDGSLVGPGNRRFALCSGPFTMVPGVSDTQEIVVGNLADRGTDYLTSVTALKSSTRSLQTIFRTYLISNYISWGGKELYQTIPAKLSLSQNYPNPFNPTTTITFSVGKDTYVSLQVYDVLGREVATIFSGELSAGSYTKLWNASALPSGVYFYRLMASSYAETKKLVLIK